jgi:hypothetical protein
LIGEYRARVAQACFGDAAFQRSRYADLGGLLKDRLFQARTPDGALRRIVTIAVVSRPGDRRSTADLRGIVDHELRADAPLPVIRP